MAKAEPQKILADVGRRIAECRHERDWTQQQFAERAEVTAKYIQRIESGGANLSIKSLARLANVLGVAPRALFDRPTSRRPKVGRPPSA